MSQSHGKVKRDQVKSHGQLERHNQAAPPHCKWLSILLRFAEAPHSQGQLFRNLPSWASL